jgi:mRNA-degrading endonuclease RelE of RelBE toxin-antitoxin system
VWQYEFSKEAEKSLNKLTPKIRNLIKKRIKNIGDWFEGKSELLADI